MCLFPFCEGASAPHFLMKTCPFCVHDNLEGVFYCVECGHPLSDHDALATAKLRSENQPDSSIRVSWGTAQFDQDTSIALRVQGYNDLIELIPRGELVLGRSDESTEVKLDIDLTPYGAVELGLSRHHALFRRGEDTLTLVDLNSTNGTYLNGQRLNANQPRVLRDGDEIRMGRLVCHIFFK